MFGEETVRRAAVTRSRGRLAVAAVAGLALLLTTGTAVLLGLGLRIALLGVGPLWLDELWTLDAVSRSFKEMVGARLVSDQSPPLWTSLVWGWLHLAGTYDPVTMRILPALFGMAAVAAPLVGALRLKRLRPTLLVMATLLAVSLFAIHYSVELRAYAMMVAFGSMATVIWAGLLTDALPRSKRWIFLFALTGALGGFGHYYGNLLYLAESAVLLVVLVRSGRRRPVAIHLLWGAASLVPVIGWYIVTRPWARDEAVAGAPSLAGIQTWAAYAFAPLTHVTAGTRPGDPDPSQPLGLAVLGVAAIAIASVLLGAMSRPGVRRLDAVRFVGLASLAVVLLGIAGAWIGSTVLPPSMNTRNLSVLLPAAYLLVACAATLPRGTARHVSGMAVALVWVASAAIVATQHGISSHAPPWQAQAGYRDAVRYLVAASDDPAAPRLVGVETFWDWHGQWDAALAAELGTGPMMPTDGSPLPVTWVQSAAELPAEDVGRPIIAFADDPDGREASVFDWARELAAACEVREFGGPGVGRVEVLRCE